MAPLFTPLEGDTPVTALLGTVLSRTGVLNTLGNIARGNTPEGITKQFDNFTVAGSPLSLILREMNTDPQTGEDTIEVVNGRQYYTRNTDGGQISIQLPKKGNPENQLQIRITNDGKSKLTITKEQRDSGKTRGICFEVVPNTPPGVDMQDTLRLIQTDISGPMDDTRKYIYSVERISVKKIHETEGEVTETTRIKFPEVESYTRIIL